MSEGLKIATALIISFGTLIIWALEERRNEWRRQTIKAMARCGRRAGRAGYELGRMMEPLAKLMRIGAIDAEVAGRRLRAQIAIDYKRTKPPTVRVVDPVLITEDGTRIPIEGFELR